MKIKSKTVKEKAYKSLVRPIVEYASTVWDPYTRQQIDEIEKVQRRGARFVMGDYEPTASVTTMIDDLKWESLQSRRERARLTMMYKIKNNQVAVTNPDLVKPIRTSRYQNEDCYIPISTTKNFRKFSFFPRTITAWNSLPNEIKSAPTLDSFTNHLSRDDILP